MSGPLHGKVFASSYGHGDPNVRLAFLAVAEEHGSPRQKRRKGPDGRVRLGIREFSELIGCDHATVPDVIDRAEDEGLKVDWPGPKSRLGYMLPADLYPEGEQVKGRPRPRRTGGTVAPVSEDLDGEPSGGTVPPDLVAPCHHAPSLTSLQPSGATAVGAAEDQSDSAAVRPFRRTGGGAAGGVLAPTADKPRRSDRGASTTTDADERPPPPLPTRPRAIERPGPARASPSAPTGNANGRNRPGRMRSTDPAQLAAFDQDTTRDPRRHTR